MRFIFSMRIPTLYGSHSLSYSSLNHWYLTFVHCRWINDFLSIVQCLQWFVYPPLDPVCIDFWCPYTYWFEIFWTSWDNANPMASEIFSSAMISNTNLSWGVRFNVESEVWWEVLIWFWIWIWFGDRFGVWGLGFGVWVCSLVLGFGVSGGG